jgi:hypothetical protein
MGKCHQIIGGLGIVAFLLTGAYMRIRFPAMEGVSDVARLLMRSRHIYLLLGSLVNLGVGTYYVAAPAGWRSGLQRFSSALLLIAPPLLLAAFVDEPRHGILEGQLARTALYGLLGGVVLQAIAVRRSGEPLDAPRQFD